MTLSNGVLMPVKREYFKIIIIKNIELIYCRGFEVVVTQMDNMHAK